MQSLRMGTFWHPVYPGACHQASTLLLGSFSLPLGSVRGSFEVHESSWKRTLILNVEVCPDFTVTGLSGFHLLPCGIPCACSYIPSVTPPKGSRGFCTPIRLRGGKAFIFTSRKNVEDFTGPRERSDLGFINFDVTADILSETISLLLLWFRNDAHLVGGQSDCQPGLGNF